MKQKYDQISELIQNHEVCIILAHKSIDLDAFGSALCAYQIIESFGKKAFILLSDHVNNSSIQKSIELLKDSDIKINYIKRDKLSHKKENVLILIVDTNKRELLEYQGILEKYHDIVVIDHHLESENTIDNCVKYIDNRMSSTAEMMVGYLQFLKQKVPPAIATILLAGLVVDTNNFNLKTTSKTYESAASLMKMGADNIEKQQLLKENKESYVTRQDFVKNSIMINEHMALCVMDHHIYQNHELALIAEDLLQFDSVEASFTIGFVGKRMVGISARSMGTIDVERYMRLLGGGGHKTEAACIIKTGNLQKVKKKLLKLIQE